MMTPISRRRFTGLAGLSLTTMAGGGVRAAMTAATGDGETWRLADLFASDASWERAFGTATTQVAALADNAPVADAAALESALRALADAGRGVGRLVAYAELSNDADLADAAGRERRSRAEALLDRVDAAAARLDARVVTLGADRVEAMLRTRTGLAPFAYPLREAMRQAPHRLTAEGEALLASAAPVLRASAATARQLTGADLPRPQVTLTTGTRVRLDAAAFGAAAQSPVRADRVSAYEAFWGSFAPFEGTLGTTLVGAMQADTFAARARGYPSALAAALADSAIPEAAYRAAVDAAHRGFPLFHRYLDVRRRALGLATLRYPDLTVPLASSAKSFTLTDMRALLIDATAPLGPAYAARLRAATGARWMDARPRPGKLGGGFTNARAYDVHPFVLLNLSASFTDASNYAHEWGHAMHYALANAAQPYQLARPSIFIAEIASTTNEQLLVRRAIARAAASQDKLYFVSQQLRNFANTFFQQALLAEFELAAHTMVEQGETPSGARLSATYLALLRRYHGPAVAIDDRYGIAWANSVQLFNAFYVFQYATSITGAVHFASTLTAGDAAARERYLGVLRAGGSAQPYRLLRDAGLDLAAAEPYDRLLAEFGRTIELAETLVGGGGARAAPAAAG